MNTKQTIDQLWDEFRQSINEAYASAKVDPLLCLHDYAENISWNDSTARLLGRETANERQHRSNRPSVPGFSAESASKLILMSQAAVGSKLDEMPAGTEFLVFRQTAAEARLIGFLARNFISDEWRARVEALDYAELMKAGY